MRKTDRLYVSEDDCNALMRVTAEMLAMPERACRLRNCRRKRRCSRIMTRTRDAVCVHRLPPAQHAVFEELYEKVILIADDIPDAVPAPDPEARALEEAAIEIIRATRARRPRMARKFDDWVARYRRQESGENESAPFVLADDLDPDDFRNYG